MTPAETEQAEITPHSDPFLAPNRTLLISFGTLFIAVAVGALRLAGSGVSPQMGMILIGGTLAAIASGTACFSIVRSVARIAEDVHMRQFAEADEVEKSPV